MRYLHPIQAHERFLGSGCYRFAANGQTLAKTESWAIHAHPDGEKFARVDMDARQEDGKSILAEALLTALRPVRFDIRYENDKFEGGIKKLRRPTNGSTAPADCYSMNGRRTPVHRD